MKQVLFILLVFISFQGFSQNVKIRRCDSLEVMKTDLVGEKTWKEAKTACENLGDGWRLPTKDELYWIYNKKYEIGGFNVNNFYWSSTEGGYNFAWGVGFGNGEARNQNQYSSTYSYVRAVRDLK
jgi:hypothetical protein